MRSGSSRKLDGRDRTQPAAGDVLYAAEGIEQRSVGEAERERIDGEVAPRHVLLDRDPGVTDDVEIAVARAGRALAPRRCDVDAAWSQRPNLAVIGM